MPLAKLPRNSHRTFLHYLWLSCLPWPLFLGKPIWSFFIYTNFHHLNQTQQSQRSLRNPQVFNSLLLQMASTQNPSPDFHDFLPTMAHKLGGDGLIDELCNGFNLLVDADKGVITFDSLKRNSALLGLQDLSDEDLLCMMREGDGDGDGALNQMEFCVLMFRLSPELMEESQFLLEEALIQEFN